MTIYLSVDNPRWLPTTEQDITTALEQGLLSETHWLELKRELPSGRGSNKELARDLASLAVDGGALIIGLEELDDDTVIAAPQPLAQLKERVEQVARTIPDPPLAVLTRPIPTIADATRGFLVVTVPPSPSAPHMVDNRYLHRGDKTKHYLADAEVLSLHQRRRATEQDMLGYLEWMFERDPAKTLRDQSHLFICARPTPGRPDMLADVVHGAGWAQRLGEFRDRAFQGPAARLQEHNVGVGRDLNLAQSPARREHGAALSSYEMASDRTISPSDGDTVELEVDEDGTIRMFCGQFSAFQSTLNTQVVVDRVAVVYCYRAIALAIAAAEHSGYFGNWAFAMGGTRLRGRLALTHVDAHNPARSAAEQNVYRRAAAASYAELSTTPGAVADRLVGPLLRWFDIDGMYAPLLSDPQPHGDAEGK